MKQLSRIAAAVGFCTVALLGAACSMSATVPAGGVRFQGALSDLASSASSATAGGRDASVGSSRPLPRSLAAAAVNVAALPVVVGPLDVEAAQEEPVGEDGSFQVDVPGDTAGDTYVLLATDPGLGVGLEQALGWLELPVGGGESSTGWPVGNADDGTVVDLGLMSGTGGTFVPGTSSGELYETLGVEEADLLFAAQRDNALKTVANRYLNRNSQLRLQPEDLQTLEGSFANGKNAFTPVDDALVQYTYRLHFEAEVDGLTWLDFKDGDNVIEITPPAEVTTTSGDLSPIAFGPANPIRSDEYWPNGGQPNETDINGLAFLGPPPEGLWTVNVNGEKDITVDLGFGNLYDPDGNLYYFVPRLKINVDGSELVTSIELTFVYWDFDAREYRELTNESVVPVLWTFVQIATSDGSELVLLDEELEFVNGVAEAPSEFYWHQAAADRTLHAIHVAYDLGTPVNFVFEGSPP